MLGDVATWLVRCHGKGLTVAAIWPHSNTNFPQGRGSSLPLMVHTLLLVVTGHKRIPESDGAIVPNSWGEDHEFNVCFAQDAQNCTSSSLFKFFELGGPRCLESNVWRTCIAKPWCSSVVLTSTPHLHYKDSPCLVLLRENAECFLQYIVQMGNDEGWFQIGLLLILMTPTSSNVTFFELRHPRIPWFEDSRR